MFVFSRTELGGAEVYQVYLPAVAFPDPDSRFGRVVALDFRRNEFREVGVLVLIRDAGEVGYFLGCEARLTEPERSTLYQQIELLAGKSVHAYGAEPQSGWFEYDLLHD